MLKRLGIRIRNPIRAYIDAQVKARLATPAETDETIYIGRQTAGDIFRDRFNYDRQTVLAEILLQWRTNPIARRIVDTIKEFVIGDGFTVECKHARTKQFLTEFWNHPLNNLDEQTGEWCDEQTRSGDLFILFSVDPITGMSYVRAVPSELIDDIQTAGNDYRQEEFYLSQDVNTPPYPAYDPNDPEQTQFMLHFPTNRPVGSAFGESDMTPVLKWLGRLSTLLNDRVIMNHLRNLIVYVVTGKYTDANARRKREAELNANPPNPGSVIVNDESEVWGTLSPNVQAFDANLDILAIKKHIATGVGLPLHYLAEPESSTRTTAEAAGTPTFRKFKLRQNHFAAALTTILKIAAEKRRYFADRRISANPVITVGGDDVTERDNSILALAAARIQPALSDLFDRMLIDESTYLTIFYGMMGVDYDANGPQPKGLRRSLSAPGAGRTPAAPEAPNSPQPGEEPDPKEPE